MATEQELFSVLKAARRVWGVGAIHGDAHRLAAVHADLERRFRPGDRIVYLGNFLGHGPAILATQDEILRFRRALLSRHGMFHADVAFLRGEQEEMWRKLLQLQLAPNPGEVLEWMLAQGAADTLRAYGGGADDGRAACRAGATSVARWTTGIRHAVRARPGHDELLMALRRAAYTEGGELLLVAAGIDPNRPVSQQGDTFWWGSGYFSEIGGPYAGYRRVVRGFDRARRGPDLDSYAVTLDGGGRSTDGSLTAACFNLDGTLDDRIEV